MSFEVFRPTPSANFLDEFSPYIVIMTAEEPQLVNVLFAVANKDGEWRYIQPDELSEILFTSVD